MTRLSALDLRVAPGRRRREAIVRLAFAAAAGLTVLVSVAIVVSLATVSSSRLLSRIASSTATLGATPSSRSKVSLHAAYCRAAPSSSRASR